MATQLQLRRGTTTEHTSFTGAVGEVTVDTTKDVLVVHDGATVGGFPQAARANADGTISLIKKDGASAGSINSSGLFNNTLTSTNTDQALTAAQGKVLRDNKLDKASISATGSAPYFVCRAWVNFNAVPLNGTYSQSGTTVTVTMTAHGMSVGQNVNLSITSGTALSGMYTVATVPDANTFIYGVGTSLTTSGNVTRNTFIRASGNILGITDNGVGLYTLNFITALLDSIYAVSVLHTDTLGGSMTGKIVSTNTSVYPVAKTATTVQIGFGAGGSSYDCVDTSAVFFR